MYIIIRRVFLFSPSLFWNARTFSSLQQGSPKSNQAITYEHIQFYANYPLARAFVHRSWAKLIWDTSQCQDPLVSISGGRSVLTYILNRVLKFFSFPIKNDPNHQFARARLKFRAGKKSEIYYI